ncbi:MAG: HPP family protein [Planctomycetaceae bacterium]
MAATTEVRAADIMVEAGVTISPEASLRDALDLMIEHHVSGLPVVDVSQRCIGVLSASDILSVEQEHIAEEDESLGAFFNAESQSWETIRMRPGDERLADVTVLDVMSREPVSVKEDASLKSIAQTMVRKEVHRVVVLDANGSLRGIISAFDFVKQAAT